MASSSSSPSSSQAPQQSLGQLASSSPALSIIVNTAVLSASAGLLGSTVGVLRQDPQRPPVVLATRALVNAASAGFPFFATREYVINPLLSSASTALRQGHAPRPSRHTINLGSSTISGLAIGAGSGYYYGYIAAAETSSSTKRNVRRPAVQGAEASVEALQRGWQAAGGARGLSISAVRVASLAFVAQLAVNEAAILLGIGSESAKEEEDQKARSLPDTTASKAPAATSTSSSSSPPPRHPYSEPAATPPWWSPARIWPLVRLTDEEYLARLEAERSQLLTEKAQVQKEVDRVAAGGGVGNAK
ncbi:hypothetical protein BDZ90DRAFT_260041 [Jaminaea rosea]|uniref:Uncharacterized protein n=1 Tax=Jaminaea rosea TaxID=1569628 RepID=A0A316UWC6_9BASI|nr:hypothetical protein BDZ90DRAFT_260041 [Jaminaea rosea]PWN28223.1 hypothetical protein BDZ90DRAFT_260041 [Jaminaea rosea]